MPTPTFFNLPEGKQNKILDVSKKEFSTYGFYNASINRIIKEADISRGSFYQYFENKEDLFLHLNDRLKKIALELVVSKLNPQHNDIFEVHLLMFDVLTQDYFKGEDREFIETTISQINLKLINHLLGFYPQKEITEQIAEISKLINLDNLKGTTQEELMNIYTILMNTTLYQIVIFFSGVSSYDRCRANLMSQFELIKTGILKR